MNALASASGLLALLALGVAAWGWGRLLLDACKLPGNGIAFPATIGLALLGAAGGWLNLAALAYPPALWILLAAGWVAAIHKTWHTNQPGWRAQHSIPELLPAAVILAMALFLCATLLPGAAFNPGDDMQFYFYRPVRMLQTGSLGRDPFDPLGFDGLGIHAFLQSFTVLALPLSYLNAFDAVLCMLLGMALVAAIGRRLGLRIAIVMAALAAFVLLHPQQVNISPVFATSAYSLALVPAAVFLLDGGAPLRRAAIPLGLLLAAIAGSKITSGSFLLPAGLLFFGMIALCESTRRALSLAAVVAGWSALFMLPWLALHAQHYVGAIFTPQSPDMLEITAPAAPADGKLLWGGSLLAYNIVALAVFTAAAAAGFSLRREIHSAQRARFIPLIVLCAGAAACYGIHMAAIEPSHAVRYAIPFLLPGLAAAVLLAGCLLPTRLAPAAAVAIAVPASMALLFADTIADRMHNAIEFRSVLAERGDPRAFRDFTAWGLDPGTARWIRKAQVSVPAGQPMLALVAAPHQLLFARNPLFVVTEFGLTMPWLGLPLDADAAAIRDFLRKRGIRYVLWQTEGGVKTEPTLMRQLASWYAVDRHLARYLMSLRASLAQLAKGAKIVYTDDGLIVIDVEEP